MIQFGAYEWHLNSDVLKNIEGEKNTTVTPSLRTTSFAE